MPSEEHEAFVKMISAGGQVLTPIKLATAEERQAIRAGESLETVLAPEGFDLEELNLGGVPACRLTARASPIKWLILYCHGGGYLWLTAATAMGAMAGLVRSCYAECIGLNYRRAPEDPFPAAVEDVVAAYKATLDAGRPPAEIALAGDSAGGGLAIAALLLARQRGLPMPAAAFVFSPWTDLAVTGSSASTAKDPIVNEAGLRVMSSAYLNGADPRNPLASPLYATPDALRGLPPLLVQVGTRESLLDDSRSFVRKARSAGAEVQLVEHQDVIHMWIVMAPQLPESVAAFTRAGEFLRQLTHTQNTAR